MTEVAILTDTHWGVRSDSPVFYEYFKKSLVQFFDTIKDRDIKHVIHLGDLFDRRKYLNFVTAKRCREDFLEKLEQLGIETHIIAGNHDEYYKNTHTVNSLEEIVGNRYKNINVYVNPTEIAIDGIKILLLPWMTDSNMADSKALIKKTKAQIVGGHLELEGFEYIKGILADHGMDRSLFDKFDLVMSGHYHHRSVSGNIHYVGALCEHTWSDFNDPRGFNILDLDTRKLEFVKNTNILFNMIGYDDTTDVFARIKNEDFTYLSDTYVKILVQNKTNPYAFDLFMERIEAVNPISIMIVEENLSLDDETDEEISQAEDTPTILRKYVEGLTLPIDNDRLKNYMLKLYEEAVALERYD